MDDLSINNLPPEVLIKVFRFLNGVNLKKATLTCKLWNNLIESTCRWSLKLDYGKHEQLEQKINFTLTTNRKFGKIEIEGKDFCLSEQDHQLYEIFKRHGFNVVELNLDVCRCNNLVPIAQLLNLTPNLTCANLYEVYVPNAASDVSLDQVLLSPNLKKLKNLDIADSDQRTIECFWKAKLTAMEIWLPFHSGNCDLLVDFLRSQDMLTSLTVDSRASSILMELGKLKAPIPFRLKRLESSMEMKASPHDHDNFLRFVQTQAASLTEMRMGSNILNSVYECVFASMPKLNTLDIAADWIPQDSNIYKQLKENRIIHTVKLGGARVFNARCVVDFLKKLLNIRHLILPFSGNVFWVLAAAGQNFNRLESLSIGQFDEHTIKSVTFPNLRALHIQYLRGKINWTKFTKAHSRLAELSILKLDNKSYFTSDDIDLITTNVGLQHIRLGVGFVADDRFFEIVRSKCTNLKTLDLDKSCLPQAQGLNDNVGISVFRLYDFECSNIFDSLYSVR